MGGDGGCEREATAKKEHLRWCSSVGFVVATHMPQSPMIGTDRCCVFSGVQSIKSCCCRSTRGSTKEAKGTSQHAANSFCGDSRRQRWGPAFVPKQALEQAQRAIDWASSGNSVTLEYPVDDLK